MPQLRFAMICAANVNRSMEAHKLLKEAGLQVQSFGVNTRVKLPGESADSPNQYDFDSVSYSEIYQDLEQKNRQHYTQKGILGMLQRNMGIKKGPQRWQNHRHVSVDVAVTFEERVLERVVKEMNERDGCAPMLVVNMDVKDRHEESAIAAPHVLQLCQMLEEAEDWEDQVDEIMEGFAKETGMKPLYTICFA